MNGSTHTNLRFYGDPPDYADVAVPETATNNPNFQLNQELDQPPFIPGFEPPGEEVPIEL